MSESVSIYKNSDLACSLNVVTVDGEPWFVVREVCGVLGLENPRSSFALLDEDEKGVHNLGTLGGVQKVSIVNESGLYSLVFRSRKDAAKKFRKWVTNEVMPSIRKTGAYLGREGLSGAVSSIMQENARYKAALRVFEETGSNCLFPEFCRRLTGVLEMGPRKFIKFLKAEGWLDRTGVNAGLPSDKSISDGLMLVDESRYCDGSGAVVVTKTPRLTPKGQGFFMILLCERQEETRLGTQINKKEVV